MFACWAQYYSGFLPGATGGPRVGLDGKGLHRVGPLLPSVPLLGLASETQHTIMDHLAAVPTTGGTCTDCPTTGSSPGMRRIYRDKTGLVFVSPTCNLGSTYTTLPSCTRFYWTGIRQAVDCGNNIKRCFAQVQLGASGGGTAYWLLDHTCGDGQTSIVENDNEQCGGGELCRAAGLLGWHAALRGPNGGSDCVAACRTHPQAKITARHIPLIPSRSPLPTELLANNCTVSLINLACLPLPATRSRGCLQQRQRLPHYRHRRHAPHLQRGHRRLLHCTHLRRELSRRHHPILHPILVGRRAPGVELLGREALLCQGAAGGQRRRHRLLAAGPRVRRPIHHRRRQQLQLHQHRRVRRPGMHANNTPHCPGLGCARQWLLACPGQRGTQGRLHTPGWRVGACFSQCHTQACVL